MAGQGKVCVALVAAMMLAGCASAGVTGSPSPSFASAAPAVPKSDVGSIAGRVVDDEHFPIFGADVALGPLAKATVSDASGAFTFNDVPPGDYQLFSQRLGYDSKAVRVSVRAQEVTNVTLVLSPIEIAPDPYVLSLRHTSFIQVGNAWQGVAGFAINSTGAREYYCQSCTWQMSYDPKPEAVITEAWWPCSPCVPPVVNDDFWYLAYVNNTADTGTGIVNTFISNRERYNWTELQNDRARSSKGAKMLIRVEPGGDGLVSGTQTGAEGVSYNQRVESWHSLAYVEPIPENFTALPPRS